MEYPPRFSRARIAAGQYCAMMADIFPTRPNYAYHTLANHGNSTGRLSAGRRP